MKEHLRVLGIVALLVVPQVAAAQAARAPSQEAADLNERGMSLAKTGEYEKARELFQKAWEVEPSTIVLFNLGLAELRSTHHMVEALDHFDLYMKRSDAEPAKVEAIKKSLWSPAYSATGHIVVPDDPSIARAKLSLDGRDVNGRVLHVVPGDHELIARASSGLVSRARMHVNAGEERTATFTQETPTRSAPLAATSLPQPPAASVAAQSPPHLATSVQPVAASVPALETSARASSDRPMFAIVATAAGAVVLAGGGVGAFVAAGSADDQGRGQCASGWSSSCDGQRSTVRTLDSVALGAWIGAAALAATSVVLWVSHPAREGTKSVSLLAGPGSLGLEGRF